MDTENTSDKRWGMIGIIMRTIPVIDSRVSRIAESGKDEIPRSQIMALFTLKYCGQSHMTHVAEKMKVSNQQLTKIIDALVRRGYVKRAQDPDNRRLVKISMTAEGEAYIKGLKDRILPQLAKRFECFSDKELECMAQSFDTIYRIMKEKGI